MARAVTRSAARGNAQLLGIALLHATGSRRWLCARLVGRQCCFFFWRVQYFRSKRCLAEQQSTYFPQSTRHWVESWLACKRTPLLLEAHAELKPASTNCA